MYSVYVISQRYKLSLLLIYIIYFFVKKPMWFTTNFKYLPRTFTFNFLPNQNILFTDRNGQPIYFTNCYDLVVSESLKINRKILEKWQFLKRIRLDKILSSSTKILNYEAGNYIQNIMFNYVFNIKSKFVNKTRTSKYT